MKLIAAYVSWLVSLDNEPLSTSVLVGERDEVVDRFEQSGGRRRWIGVCAGSDTNATAQELMMFIHFNTLVVRDRVDFESVHREFLKIDEYRQRISPDTPGAEH